jgi:hypothetical protein
MTFLTVWRLARLEVVDILRNQATDLIIYKTQDNGVQWRNFESPWFETLWWLSLPASPVNSRGWPHYRPFFISEFWNFVEVLGLLGYDTLSISIYFPTFQRRLLPPSTGTKQSKKTRLLGLTNVGGKHLLKIRNSLLIKKASYPIIL